MSFLNSLFRKSNEEPVYGAKEDMEINTTVPTVDDGQEVIADGAVTQKAYNDPDEDPTDLNDGPGSDREDPDTDTDDALKDNDTSNTVNEEESVETIATEPDVEADSPAARTNDTNVEVDEISGHHTNDVNYFMDPATDLNGVADHVINRFKDAGYEVESKHLDDGGVEHWHVEANKDDGRSTVIIEITEDIAGAVRISQGSIERSSFDPTNDGEITSIISAWE